MKPVFSSPILAEGRLFVGEGYHQDQQCRLFCLDPTTGSKRWDFATSSHVESKPLVVAGRVYFGGGADGVYCLDATTGAKVWRHEGPHVDCDVCVHEDRLYGGGVGGEIFCLNATTGKPRWQIATELSAGGHYGIAGDLLLTGQGIGSLLGQEFRRRGALLALDRHTGQRLWRVDTGDWVHGRPAASAGTLYFGARDKHVYAVRASDGTVLWKSPVGSGVLSSPLLLDDARLAVLTWEGHLCTMDGADGRIVTRLDLSLEVNARGQVIPAPVRLPGTDRVRILCAGGFDRVVSQEARIWCLERQP